MSGWSQVRRGVLVLVLVNAGACKAREAQVTAGASCLSLPGAQRHWLRADPAGDGLYWIEAVRLHDYDAELQSYHRLVRYDLGSRKLEVILEHVASPFHFAGDQLVVRRTGQRESLVLLDKTGGLRSLVPDYLSVRDVEQLGDSSLAILASGDGRTAVYTLDLDQPRPVALADATVLLNAAGDQIFAREEGEGVVIDATTGERSAVEIAEDTLPQGADAWSVADSTVRVRSNLTGVERTVIPDRDAWRLTYQQGSLIARSSVTGASSRAFLLADGKATPLPTLTGGTAIFATTRVRDTLWALVGHNSGHVRGDLSESGSEAEVCSLPATGEVKLTSRQLPARFRKQQLRFFRALAKELPGVAWQVFDEQGVATTLYVELAESGGADHAAMRARARDVHAKVTSVLQDREIRTFLYFQDGWTAVHRWRRDRLRERTVSGFGDLHVTDPEDFDLEVRELVNRRDDRLLRCSGTLVNLTSAPLRDVQVRCSNAAMKAMIVIGELAPKQERAFSQVFELSEDDEQPLLEVFAGRQELVVRDEIREARVAKQIQTAVEVYGDTQLMLRSSDTRKTFYLELQGPRELAAAADAARRAVLARAHQRFSSARALFEVDAAQPLSLRVWADDKSFDYDGEDEIPAR